MGFSCPGQGWDSGALARIPYLPPRLTREPLPLPRRFPVIRIRRPSEAQLALPIPLPVLLLEGHPARLLPLRPHHGLVGGAHRVVITIPSEHPRSDRLVQRRRRRRSDARRAISRRADARSLSAALLLRVSRRHHRQRRRHRRCRRRRRRCELRRPICGGGGAPSAAGGSTPTLGASSRPATPTALPSSPSPPRASERRGGRVGDGRWRLGAADARLFASLLSPKLLLIRLRGMGELRVWGLRGREASTQAHLVGDVRLRLG